MRDTKIRKKTRQVNQMNILTINQSNIIKKFYKTSAIQTKQLLVAIKI
jgi:hypothetical protein